MFTLVFYEHRPTATRCMRVIDLNTLCGVVILEESYTNIVKVELSVLGKLKLKIERRGGNALWRLRLGLSCIAIPAAAKLSLCSS